jgi:hypothetical protein
MSGVMSLVGDGHALAAELTTVDLPESAVVLLLTLRSGAPDPEQQWVVDGIVAVVAALQDIAAKADDEGERRPVVVTVLQPADLAESERPAAEALYEALRGLAQAATLEASTARLRINVLAAGRDHLDDVARMVRHLASAGFTIGASFDLREAA